MDEKDTRGGTEPKGVVPNNKMGKKKKKTGNPMIMKEKTKKISG